MEIDFKNKNYLDNKADIDLLLKKVKPISDEFLFKKSNFTKLDSIIFVFEKDFYKFNLDCFYHISDEIEATLHIYKHNIKLNSYYGKIDYLFKIMKNC